MGQDPPTQETRREVFERIERSPGIYYAKIAESTGIPLGTVRYHCRKLVEEGLAHEETINGKHRLFPAGHDRRELWAALADSAAEGVLDGLARLEPATVSTLGEELDCSMSTLSYHLTRLEDADLVVREADGRSVVTSLRPEVRSVLAETRDGRDAPRSART